MIRFRCVCGKRVKVPASAAGKRIRCPFCGREQQAPTRSMAWATARRSVKVVGLIWDALSAAPPAAFALP
ncbi:MAG: hypothetical protein WBD18_02240, partial [Phycisphaerae bacterium]